MKAMSFNRPSATKATLSTLPAEEPVKIEPARATDDGKPVARPRKRLHVHYPSADKDEFSRVVAVQGTTKTAVLEELLADWASGDLDLEILRMRMTASDCDRLILNYHVDKFLRLKTKASAMDRNMTEVTASLVRHYCISKRRRAG